MAGLAVKVDSTSALRKFRKMRLRSNDILKAFGERTLKEINKNFRTEGKTFAGGWEPMTPLTKKLRRGSTYQLLRDTGKLAMSFDKRIYGREVLIGSVYFVAAIHHEGVNRPIVPVRAKRLRLPNKGGGRDVFLMGTKGIPKRELVPEPSYMKPILVKMLRLWYLKRIKKR